MYILTLLEWIQRNGNIIMKIIEDANLPLTCGCVIIIGNFDGVHIGHRQLIEKALELGNDMNVPVLVWTFKNHPAEFKGEHQYISTLSERLEIFEESGISLAYLADFEDFKDVSAFDFVDEWLVKKFSAKCVVCGFNFTYGKGKSGNSETLSETLFSLGVKCHVVQPVYVDDQIVSSSAIRKYITDGNMEKVEKLLGRKYSLSLVVIHGNAYGRTIGVPTANIALPPCHVVPRFGVYATLCEIDGKIYPSVSNIGVRPTVVENKKTVLCETHVLGENFDLYGKKIKVSLISMLREEQKFESFEGLVEQLHRDVENAKGFFAIMGEKLK